MYKSRLSDITVQDVNSAIEGIEDVKGGYSAGDGWSVIVTPKIDASTTLIYRVFDAFFGHDTVKNIDYRNNGKLRINFGAGDGQKESRNNYLEKVKGMLRHGVITKLSTTDTTIALTSDGTSYQFYKPQTLGQDYNSLANKMKSGGTSQYIPVIIIAAVALIVIIIIKKRKK